MGRASLHSIESSPESFHTAVESELSRNSTAASSPLHSEVSAYREARSLPRELKAHCHIFLEEQLYVGAINLLNSVLGAGCSRQRPRTNGVHVPPSSHLAVLNTILVHPMYTSRAEKHIEHVASLALSYLRSLLTVVGPVNANLRGAFQFYSSPRWSRRHEYNSDGEFSDSSTDAEEQDRLRGAMANEGSVWRRGQDFWSTIGWAFNCSTIHPQRWRYWKVWIEYMLDVLYSDWEERRRLDREMHDAEGAVGLVPTTMRDESIMLMYMEQKNGPQGGFKSIMKALFADGGSLSAAAFHEVFDKEPRGPRKDTKKRKRADIVDIENDKFGDYYDDDAFSSGTSEPPTPKKPKKRSKTASFGTSHGGLVKTVELRMRLFALLSEVTFELRTRSDIDRLYEAYASSLKVMTLDTFALFISQRPSPIADAVYATVFKELFCLLLPSNHKDPRKVDPKTQAKGGLSIAMLEHCFVQHAANTLSIEDNAKLSLVVEAALQLVWVGDSIQHSASFGAAVRRGIEARQTKIKKKLKGKAQLEPEEISAAEVLEASTNRIEVLLDGMRLAND